MPSRQLLSGMPDPGARRCCEQERLRGATNTTQLDPQLALSYFSRSATMSSLSRCLRTAFCLAVCSVITSCDAVACPVQTMEVRGICVKAEATEAGQDASAADTTLVQPGVMARDSSTETTAPDAPGQVPRVPPAADGGNESGSEGNSAGSGDNSAGSRSEMTEMPGRSCPGECCDSTDCPTNGVCVDGSCRCPDGQHRCRDECVASTSTDSCGDACDPCPIPKGGRAECNEGSCTGVCPSNTQLCAGECIPVSSACTGLCPQGTHNCSGNCVLDTSVTGCGSQCFACTAPRNGEATCDGQTCGFICLAGFKLCGDSCIPESACCSDADCDARDHQICDTDSRTCVCESPEYKDCNGTCISKDGCCSADDCDDAMTCDSDHNCVCPSDRPQACDGKCIGRNACCETCNGENEVCSSSNECVCDPSGFERCGNACIPTDECCPGTDEGDRCSRSGGSGFCNRAGDCVECVTEADCSSRGLHCDLQSAKCVECRSDDDCSEIQFGACTSNQTCEVGVGCGNGRLDPGEDCDINATGPNSSVVWTDMLCTRDCKPQIYVSNATHGCATQSVFAACTISCARDSDCPVLGAGHPRPRCNVLGESTCDLPCSSDSDCVQDSDLFCVTAEGLPDMPKVCINFF